MTILELMQPGDPPLADILNGFDIWLNEQFAAWVASGEGLNAEDFLLYALVDLRSTVSRARDFTAK